jgi:hypothetical protein
LFSFFQENKSFGAQPLALILCQYVADITMRNRNWAQVKGIGLVFWCWALFKIFNGHHHGFFLKQKLKKFKFDTSIRRCYKSLQHQLIL